MSRFLAFPGTVGVCLVVLCTGCGGSDGGGGVFTPDIEGSGIVVEEERPLSGCVGVSHFAVGEVWIRQGPQETLLVRAEDNLLEYITTEVQGGVLEIRNDPSVDLEPTRPIEFHITVPSLDRVTFAGVGSIVCPSLTVDLLAVEARGVGTLRLLDLHAEAIDVSTSSVVNVEVSGTVLHQDLSISGVGDYRARHLASRTVDARLSNIGSTTVRVSDRLTATLSNAASLYYVGSPIVNVSPTGTGEVQQIGR